jgi:hypothetical protein
MQDYLANADTNVGELLKGFYIAAWFAKMFYRADRRKIACFKSFTTNG